MDDRRRLSPPCGPQPASVTANNPLALRGPKPHRPEASPGSQPASSERPPHTGSPWLTAPRAARPVDPGPRRCPGSWKAFERPQHLTGRPGPPYANWALKLVPAGHGRKAPGGVSFALACAAQRPSRARLQTGHHVRRRAEPLPLRQGYVRLLTSQLRRRATLSCGLREGRVAPQWRSILHGRSRCPRQREVAQLLVKEAPGNKSSRCSYLQPPASIPQRDHPLGRWNAHASPSEREGHRRPHRDRSHHVGVPSRVRCGRGLQPRPRPIGSRNRAPSDL